MHLEKIDNGNELELKIVVKNIEDIEAGFIFRIEDCNDGPIITPANEIK